MVQQPIIPARWGEVLQAGDIVTVVDNGRGDDRYAMQHTTALTQVTPNADAEAVYLLFDDPAPASTSARNGVAPRLGVASTVRPDNRYVERDIYFRLEDQADRTQVYRHPPTPEWLYLFTDQWGPRLPNTPEWCRILRSRAEAGQLSAIDAQGSWGYLIGGLNGIGPENPLIPVKNEWNLPVWQTATETPATPAPGSKFSTLQEAQAAVLSMALSEWVVNGGPNCSEGTRAFLSMMGLPTDLPRAEEVFRDREARRIREYMSKVREAVIKCVDDGDLPRHRAAEYLTRFDIPPMAESVQVQDVAMTVRVDTSRATNTSLDEIRAALESAGFDIVDGTISQSSRYTLSEGS